MHLVFDPTSLSLLGDGDYQYLGVMINDSLNSNAHMKYAWGKPFRLRAAERIYACLTS